VAKAQLSQEEFLRVLSIGRDPARFAEDILQVRLNRAQRRWLRLLVRPDGTWRMKGFVHVAANQIGKTLGLAIIILWAITYKIGMPKHDVGKWVDVPYTWYHVSPTQQQAYLPLRDIEQLIKGAHPAQGDRRPVYPEQMVEFVKLEGYYDGVRTIFGAEAQFRTTEEKAKALQGRRAAGISFDEAAFEIHLSAVINEVLLMRLISTGGPLIVVSTPNGMNQYYDLVQSIVDTGTRPEDAEDGERSWETAHGWGLLWSVIEDNVGFGVTEDEVAWRRASLDPAIRDQQLAGAFVSPSEAFFVPADPIVKAFRDDMPDSTPPVPGHAYVAFWDPSVSTDPTVGIVLDVTRKPWRGVWMVRAEKPWPVTDLILQIGAAHALYGSARDKHLGPSRVITGWDATSMGGALLRQQLTGVTPSRPLNFAGPSMKIDTLTNLRAALSMGDIILPSSWISLRRELLNYRLDDKKIQQDTVMCLAGGAWIASRGWSADLARPFDPHGRVAQVLL
jgi:hypothetical protein